MAAQNITQERLILSNLVQLFLFWAPQFALFLLPSRATSLLSILSCCLPISLLVLLYFYIWKYFSTTSKVFRLCVSPSVSLSPITCWVSASRQDHTSSNSPTSPHWAPSPARSPLPKSSRGLSPRMEGVWAKSGPRENCTAHKTHCQSFSHFFSPTQPYSLWFTPACSFGTVFILGKPDSPFAVKCHNSYHLGRVLIEDSSHKR